VLDDEDDESVEGATEDESVLDDEDEADESLEGATDDESADDDPLDDDESVEGATEDESVDDDGEEEDCAGATERVANSSTLFTYCFFNSAYSTSYRLAVRSASTT